MFRLVPCLLLAALLPDVTKAQLQVGASAVDISPTEYPAPVNGSLAARFASRVSDPMHARSLVIESRGNTLALCICDLCMISDEVVAKARALAAEKTGIAPEAILIAATHTHSAATVCPVFGSDPDPAFVEALPARIAAGMVAAHADRELAEIGWSSADEPDHVFNRRWLLKEGASYENAFGSKADRARMNPGHENPDLDRQAGPVDPEVFVLAARRKTNGSPIAVLGNLQPPLRRRRGPDLGGLLRDVRARDGGAARGRRRIGERRRLRRHPHQRYLRRREQHRLLEAPSRPPQAIPAGGRGRLRRGQGRPEGLRADRLANRPRARLPPLDNHPRGAQAQRRRDRSRAHPPSRNR